MNPNSRRVPAVAAALASIGVFLSGAAAHAQSGGTIQACYDKRNGQLRIAAPNQCTSSELPISWSIQTPAQGVKSLNTLTGDVTLAAGANVTITPAGQTLTIAASGGGGAGTVQHDATLTGDGTGASLLGVAVPLALSSQIVAPVISAAGGGVAVQGAGAHVGVYGKGNNGSGVASLPTSGVTGDADGFGVYGIGTSTGVVGATRGSGEVGVQGAAGGSDFFTHAGVGVVGSGGGDGGQSAGGNDTSGGTGVAGFGGLHDIRGGDGVVGIGGDASTAAGSIGGTGIVGKGGKGEGNVVNGLAGFFDGPVQVAGDLTATGTVEGYVHGQPVSGGTQAGQFSGNVDVAGQVAANSLSVSGTKNFRIDHPLDPANKYLLHAAIESSEVLNLYTGKVTLDATGAAVVRFPEWFQALNTDFRYALTPIGAPGPNLYVAEEISDNRFTIAGGAPGMKVSWQVTGVRSDAELVAHPFKVEQDKRIGSPR